MVEFWAVDRDVYRSRQSRVCDDLIVACGVLKSSLVSVDTTLSRAAQGACADFRGYFADVFRGNCVVRVRDVDALVDALDRIVVGLGSARKAAQAEQQRIDRAVAWQKEHDEWERKTNQGGFSEFWYDLWNSEPVIDESCKHIGTPPSIPAYAGSAGVRSTPRPGVAHGAASVSSARPEDLDGFVRASVDAVGEFRAAIASFQEKYDAFEAGWTWKTGSVAIAGMDDLIATFKVFNTNNRHDGEWLGVIAGAFRVAGSGGDIVSLSDQSLFAVVEHAGIGMGRQGVEIPPLSLVGMNPTTGFAGDPVNTVTGNFVEPEVDVAFDGGAESLSLTRIYNSVTAMAQRKMGVDARPVGVFGPGWASILDQHLLVDDEDVTWVRSDGRHTVFSVASIDDVMAPGLSIDDIPSRVTRAQGENFWLHGRRFADTSLAEHDSVLREHGYMCRGDMPVWVVSDNAGARWVFDRYGMWLGVSDGPGNVVIVERDERALITGIVHVRGRRIDIDYVDGMVAAVRTSDGRRLDYTYDKERRLSEVRRHGVGERRYVFNDDGLIERVISPAGVVECVNTYDEAGRVVSQISEYGRTTRFAYLPGHVTAVSDVNGERSNTWIADSKGRTVGVIDSQGERQSMSYDQHGNLVYSRDRAGDVSAHFYDERGRRIRSILPTHADISYEWDEYDRLTRVCVDDGSSVIYRYARAGDRDPSEIVDPSGGVTHLEWSDDGLLECVTDPEGVKVWFGYDAHGDVISSTNVYGHTSWVKRDDAGRIVEAITPLGHSTRFTYDVNGYLIGQVDPDGARYTCTYDHAGRVTSVTAPDGGVTAMEYGPHGQVVKTTDPLGRVIERDFDDLGNVQKLRLPGGVSWLFHHDSLSRLIGVVDPAGNTWKYGYSVTGSLVSRSDPTGVKHYVTGRPSTGHVSSVGGDGTIAEVIEFDIYGRPVTTTNAAGDSEVVVYDACGRPVELLDADGGLTRLERDLAGRVVKHISAQGRQTTYSYDACGRVSAVTDPRGGVMRYVYDADSRLVERTNPVGETASYKYDPVGRLIEAFIPGLGHLKRGYDKCGRLSYSRDLATGIRRFAYDRAGQLVRVTNGVGGATTYGYDERGRVIRITDPLGRTTTRTYNELDKVTSVTDPLGRVTSATYDAAGRQLTQTDADGVILSFDYDDNGARSATYADGRLLTRIERDLVNRTIRLIDQTNPHDIRPVTHTLIYDRLGRLVVKTLDNPNVKNSDRRQRTSRWSYDKDGYRTSYTTTNGRTATYTYNQAGTLSSITHPDLGHVDFVYDAAGRLVSSDHDGVTHHWEYDHGFIAAHRYQPRAAVAQDVILIDHDAWGRVSQVTTDGDAITYTYDQAGQLTGLTSVSGTSQVWEYNSAGQLVHQSGKRGNRDGDSTAYTLNFIYDEAGQLTRSTRVTETNVESTEYLYTRTGRRSKSISSKGRQVSYDWDKRGWLTGLTRIFHGDTVSIETHVDGLGELAAINHDTRMEWDIASRIPVLSGVNDASIVGLPGGDYLGEATNAQAMGWRHIVPTNPLDPYAFYQVNEEIKSGPMAGIVNQLPLGIGLAPGGGVSIDGYQWLGARLYDPATHAFLTPDPLANPMPGALWETNPYNYANNNPLILSDPTGFRPITDAQLDAYNNTRHSSTLGAFGEFIGDNWQYLALAAVAVGACIIGGPLGTAAVIGMALGAGTTLVGQVATRQPINWKDVALNGAIGGATALVGGGAASALARTSMGAVGRNIAQNTVEGVVDGVTDFAQSGGPHTLTNLTQSVARNIVTDNIAGGVDLPKNVTTHLPAGELGDIKPYTSQQIYDEWQQLKPGDRHKTVRVVGSEEELLELHGKWTRGVVVDQVYKDRVSHVLADKTRVSLRDYSSSGGKTIDLRFNDDFRAQHGIVAKAVKVHIE